MIKPLFLKTFLFTALSIGAVNSIAFAESINLKSYGKYKRMIHMNNTEGVIGLKKAIPAKNSYAVGAIQNGSDEITVLNGKVYLDYGKDGMGNVCST